MDVFSSNHVDGGYLYVTRTQEHTTISKDKKRSNVTSINRISKSFTSFLSNLNNFHSLEIVDRVSETQLQISENSNWWLKC